MRRLSPALLFMLMLGVIGLLVAVYFGKKLFAVAEEPPEELINLPMALTDLEVGTKITEAHIGLGKAIPSKITRDVIRNNRVLVGRIVKEPIEAAQPISTFSLFPPGQGPEPDIAIGMRAVSIPVQGLGSVIQPGHYVDVHFTPSSAPNDNQTGGMTMTLFKGVKVQSINGNTVAGEVDSRRTEATLELTPEQANIILLAKDKGDLNLVYNPEGKGVGVVALDDEDRATLDQILGLDDPEEPEDLGPPHVTEVYSGAGRRIQQFRNGKRLDLYAIENYDYHRYRDRGGYGYGDRGWGGGGWGGYGYGTNAPAPDFEFQGSYGNGGYYSVPSGNPANQQGNPQGNPGGNNQNQPRPGARAGEA